MDLDQDVHRQHFTVGLLGELVRAVAGADRDGQRVDAGLLDELDGLIGIGDVLEAAAASAVAIFNAAEHADLAFDRHAGVRHSTTSFVTRTL